MPNDTGVERNVKAQHSIPSPDCDEFLIGATQELDVSTIGDYPVRKIVLVSGSGTLKYRTAGSSALGGTTNRTATLAAGDSLEPLQITSIRGTSDGTSAGLTVRVYK